MKEKYIETCEECKEPADYTIACEDCGKKLCEDCHIVWNRYVEDKILCDACCYEYE